MAADLTPDTTLPHRIAVLCYLFDESGRVLMLHRAKPPNQDLYSPVGGKLETERGECPWACARREIHEETGITVALDDLRLCGLVSETAYERSGHWMIFLFEVTRRIAHEELAFTTFDEGTLEWVPPDSLLDLTIPETDRRVIWPLLQKYRGGFFGVHIDCRETPFSWTLTQTI